VSKRLNALGGETLQEWKDRKDSQQRLAYERRLSKLLLRRAGADEYFFQNAKEYDHERQENYMTFAWLRDTFPSLPVQLVAEKLGAVDLSSFFRVKQRNNPIWKKWREMKGMLVNAHSPGIPFGLVFPMSEVTGLKDMIMHQVELPYFSDEETTDPFVFAQCKHADGSHVTLEKFTDFSVRLSRVWRV
jgi:hypothetical protein